MTLCALLTTKMARVRMITRTSTSRSGLQ